MIRHIGEFGFLVLFGITSALAQQVPKALEGVPQGRFFFDFSVYRGAKAGKWWTSPDMAQKLGLTDDQKRRMDDIFQQHRLKLIDLEAALEKEEVSLEPLVGADQPDDTKVFAQVDRVALARAELEKANSRMLWQVRRVLTPDQWKQMQPQPPALKLLTPKVKVTTK